MTTTLMEDYDINSAYDTESRVVVAPDAETPMERFHRQGAKIEILAYTGGKLYLPELKYPIVVRLTGIKTRQRTPILYKHNDDAVLGNTERIMVSSQSIEAAGKLSSQGYQTWEVVRRAINDDYPWQASIRAHATKISWIESGMKANINGQSIEGPCYVAEESTLREITIAPIGVDPETEVTITAMMTNINPIEEPNMAKSSASPTAPNIPATEGTDSGATNQNQQSPAGIDLQASVPNGAAPISIADYNAQVAANEERISQVRTICASYGNPTFQPEGSPQTVDLCAHAIRANWTPDIVRAIAARNDRPQSSPAIHSHQQEMPTEMVIEAALCRAANVRGGTNAIDMEAHFNPQTLETVDRNPDLRRGIGLQQLLLMCAYIGGMSNARRFSRLAVDEIGGVIRAAFSTNAMSSIVSNAANKFMTAGFKQVEQQWRKIAATRAVNNFLEIESYRLIGDGSFEKIPASGEIPAGKVSDQKYTNKAEEYGKYISVDRVSIVNDDPGILTQAPMQLARGAGKTLNKIFWAEFLKDKGTFFTAGRGNYLDGATSDLGLDGLSLAAAALMKMPDDGQGSEAAPMDTAGRFLVCGANDLALAQALYVSQTVQSGNTGKVLAANVHAGKYEPVGTAFLTDPDEWFLLADPADLAMIEIAFLNGNTEPMISEALPMPTHTGFVLNGLYDFGVRKQEYRAAVHMKGKV